MLEDERRQAPAASTALLGREAEIALVDELLTELPVRGGALCLYGEHGLGRSAMLEYAHARASEMDFALLRAAGSVDESDLAFAALSQALQPIYHDVARLPQGVRDRLLGAAGLAGDSSAPGEEIADSLARLVQGLSARRPLLVLVDDMELVDAKSAAALLQVFVRRWQPGAAIIVAGQAPVRPDMLQAIPSHRLRPLPPQLSRVLVARSRPELSSSAVSAVVSCSGGYPLILLELALEASIDPSGFVQAVAAGQLPVPARLKERCASQVLGLSAQGRRQLLMAALASPTASRLAAGELTSADHEAVRDAGLVAVAADGTLSFCHEVARRAVIELSGSGERRAIHRQLADVAAVDEQARTRHLAAASLAPDAELSRSVMAAARETLRDGDASQAIRGFLRAATLAPSPEDRGSLLARAAHLQAVVMGRLGEADALLRGATDHVDGQAGLRATTTDVILRFTRAGDVRTSYRLLTGALARASTSDDGDAVIDALEALLTVCAYAGRRDYWEGCLDLLRRLGISDAMVCMKAMLYVDPLANASRVGAELQRRLAALPSEQNPFRAAHLAALGLSLPLVAQTRSALLSLALDAREGGPVVPGAVALKVLSVHAFLNGEWDEATRLADAAVEMSEANDLVVNGVVSRFATALVAAGRGDVVTCHETCAAMVNWARPRDVRLVERVVSHVRTLAALASCDYRGARHHARPFFETALAPVDLLHLMDPVEVATLNGDHDVAQAIATSYQQADVGSASPHAQLLVAGARALCAPTLDIDLYEEALALPAAAEFWFDRARIELRYGQRLRRARETLAARRHLELALDLFESMRAHPWTEQTRVELLATNPTKTKRADTAWPALTAQELRVAELAAEGLSNAKIGERLQISARTVGAHLHHVFEKAGVKNRTMLAASLMHSDAPHVPINRLGRLTGPDDRLEGGS